MQVIILPKKIQKNLQSQNGPNIEAHLAPY